MRGMSATSHRVGPERDRLLLRTSRQGLAAQAGHDLTIEVTRWSGEVVVADDPAASMVVVSAEVAALRVVEGTGGLKPLSERDKREIAKTARELLDADRLPEARFVSASVTAAGLIRGDLTIRGETRTCELTVTDLGGGRYRATGTVLQSRYGIRPYTAFFGALKLADPVAVEAEVDLSG